MVKSRFGRKISNRFLLPIRKEIVRRVVDGSEIIDVGCGEGELLFLLADKIKGGLGVDVDFSVVDYARRRCAMGGIDNLDFECGDFRDVEFAGSYDVGIMSYVLHGMSGESARDILNEISEKCDRIVVADYNVGGSFWKKFFVGLDERLTGHYEMFSDYIKCGVIEILIESVGLRVKDYVEVGDVSGVWVLGRSF